MAAETFVIAVDASAARRELKAFETAAKSTADALAKLASAGSGGFADLSRQIASSASGFEKLKSLAGISSIAKELSSVSKALGSVKAPTVQTISTITQLTRALQQFRNVTIPRGLANDLSVMSKGLSSLQIPNAETIRRLPGLFTELAKLSNVRINAQTGANLKFLGDGLRSVGSVPVSNIQRLPVAFDALGKLKIDGDRATALKGLGETLRGLSDFRAPSAAAVNNLQRMLMVLSTADVGRIRATATAMHGLVLPAINARTLSPQPTRPAAPALSGTMTNSGAGTAATGLHQLESAANSARGAIGLLAGALGGLTLGKLTSDIFSAGRELMSFKLTMDAVASSSTEAGDHLRFLKDFANSTGTDLESALPAYQRLGAAMASLGYNAADTQRMFKGLSSALTVMHIGPRDSALAVRDIANAFAEGSLHARELRALATHIPSATADVLASAGVKGSELRGKFQEGGFDTDVLLKTADLWSAKFGSQIPAAMKSSTAQLNLLSNAWLEFRQSVFENGFDRGLSSFAQRLRDAFSTAGINDAAKQMGSAFETAFASMATGVNVIARHRDEFTALAVAIGGVTVASLGLRVITGIVNPLMNAATGAARLGAALLTLNVPFAVPLLAGAAALAVVVSQSSSAEDALSKIGKAADWVKDSFALFAAGSVPIVSAAFAQMEEDGKSLVNVFKEIVLYGGELKSWAANGFKQAPDWRAQYQKRREALDNMFTSSSSGSAAASGTATGEAFASRFTAILGKMGEVAGPALKGLMGGLSKDLLADFNAESAKTAKTIADTSHALQSQAQYSENAARQVERLRQRTEDLQPAQQKLYESLSPATKALKEYGEALETINGMKGRKDDAGKVIDASRIASLKQVLDAQTLAKVNPFASDMKGMTEQLELRAKYQGSGNKDTLEIELKVLEERNKLLEKGHTLTDAQADAYRNVLRASKELEQGGSNGFTQWANSVKSETESLNDNIKSTMGSLSDGLSKLITEGRGKFKNLGEAIRSTFAGILSGMAQRFIKAGIDNLMASAIKQFVGNDQSGIMSAIFGGKKIVNEALSGLSDKAVASMNVTAANVVINGGIGTVGTPAASAFTASGPASGAAMGGVSPQAVTGSANPALTGIGNGSASAFGTQTPASLLKGAGTALDPLTGLAKVVSGQTGTSIGYGSANAFGSGISPTTPGVVSLSLGNAGAPLGNITSGIDQFGKLTPLLAQPLHRISPLGSGSPLDAFGKQSPASLLESKTASDNLIRTGVAPTGITKPFVGGSNSPAAVEAYVRQAASARGINPDIAATVVSQESRFKFDAKKVDAIESSYGPMQLNAKNGLGVTALKQGINVRDPSTWRQQVDFGMDTVQRDGWRQWMGAKDRGIGRWDGIDRNFKRTSSLDTNPTGSIASQGNQLAQQMKPQFQQVGLELQKDLSQSIKQTAPDLTSNLTTAFKGGGQGAESELGGFASKIQETGSAAQSAEGGLGGLISKLGSLGGGGGGFGGLFGGGGDVLAGVFAEGGRVGEAVESVRAPASMWSGAPHFSEGGTTSLPGGGHPAVLHDSEAVVRLTRGREIPVELRQPVGGGDRDGGMSVTNNVLNLQAKDSDSFRRNAHQTMVAFQQMVGRAAARSG